MTAFDRNVFVKMLLSVSQKDDAALFPKSERSPYSKYTWNPAYKGVDDYLLSQAATM